MKNETLELIAQKSLWSIAESSSTPVVIKEQVRKALLEKRSDYKSILANVQESISKIARK